MPGGKAEKMVAGLKRVLLLSDHEGLASAIEWNLNGHGGLEVTSMAPGSSMPPGARPASGACDLIIVAMSSPASEPLVALFRASLLRRIGQVPLLIISDRPFHSEPDDKITHMDFPFDIDQLLCRIRQILAGQPAPPDEKLWACAREHSLLTS
jgi:hypothetical protein